jgi:hypothetical protein
MTEKRRLEVLEYDEDWPSLFEEEAVRLRNVFGTTVVKIFHVGSTSVSVSAFVHLNRDLKSINPPTSSSAEIPRPLRLPCRTGAC